MKYSVYCRSRADTHSVPVGSYLIALVVNREIAYDFRSCLLAAQYSLKVLPRTRSCMLGLFNEHDFEIIDAKFPIQSLFPKICSNFHPVKLAPRLAAEFGHLHRQGQVISSGKINMPLVRLTFFACVAVSFYIDRGTRRGRIHRLEVKGKKTKVRLQARIGHGCGICDGEVGS